MSYAAAETAPPGAATVTVDAAATAKADAADARTRTPPLLPAQEDLPLLGR